MNTQVIFYDLLSAIYNNDRVIVNEKLLQLLELNKSNESLPTVEKYIVLAALFGFGASQSAIAVAANKPRITNE